MTFTADWTGERFAHEAFVYDDPEQLRERLVPFVNETLDAGQPLVVVVPPETADVLGGALGPRVDDLFLFEDAHRWWRGDAHRTLAAYTSAMAALVAAGRPWRLVGEPVWLEDEHGTAWSRLESACNESFADLPYYSLCLHDRRRFGAATLERIERTHPTVWSAGGVVASDRYVAPASYLRSDELPWHDLPPDASAISVTSPRQARAHVAATASAAVDGVDTVCLVASELATNALVSAPACTVATWRHGHWFVLEVRDDGPGFDATLAGYVPPLPSQPSGRGLWLVRQLVEELTVSSGPSGTVARAYVRARRH